MRSLTWSLPYEVAARYGSAIAEGAWSRLRADGVQVPDELRDALLDLDRLSTAWANRGVTSDRTSDAGGADFRGETLIGTTDAAEAIGCTTRNVVDLVHRGRLDGRKERGVWQITERSLNSYQESRNHGTEDERA